MEIEVDMLKNTQTVYVT